MEWFILMQFWFSWTSLLIFSSHKAWTEAALSFTKRQWIQCLVSLSVHGDGGAQSHWVPSQFTRSSWRTLIGCWRFEERATKKFLMAIIFSHIKNNLLWISLPNLPFKFHWASSSLTISETKRCLRWRLVKNICQYLSYMRTQTKKVLYPS